MGADESLEAQFEADALQVGVRGYRLADVVEITWGTDRLVLVADASDHARVIGDDSVEGPRNSLIHTNTFVPLEPIFRKAEQEHRIADDSEPFVAVWVFCVWGTGTLQCFP